MSKTYLVALREYMENIRTKTFWIGIFAFPVILVIASIAPILLEKAKDARTYVVIDESGWLLKAVEEKAAVGDLTEVFRETRFRFRKKDGSINDFPPLLQQLAPELNKLERNQMEAAAVFVALPAPAVTGEDTGPDPVADFPSSVRQILVASRAALQKWYADLTAEDASRISSSLDKTRFSRISIHGNLGGIRLEANERIAKDKLFALFVINKDPVAGSDGCTYVSNNLTDKDLKRWFGGMASGIIRSKRLEQKKIEPEVAGWIQEPLDFQEKKISTTGAEAEVNLQDKIYQWAPVAFVYLLFISIMVVVSMLLNNTVEEKSNRIIEVLLSSVSPLQLMSGKIIGIAFMSLTMVGSWVIFFLLTLVMLPLFFGTMPDIGLEKIAADPVFLISFVLYFLLGYLFYAAFIVGIGSVCNSLKEAQNMMTPVTMLIIIPLVAMVPVAKDPNGLLAKIMSYIPPFTPFVMMNRAAGHPSLFEYITTTLLLLLATGAVFWAAAKVFRIGILMTGKPPKLREILRWLRTSAHTIPVRKDETS